MSRFTQGLHGMMGKAIGSMKRAAADLDLGNAARLARQGMKIGRATGNYGPMKNMAKHYFGGGRITSQGLVGGGMSASASATRMIAGSAAVGAAGLGAIGAAEGAVSSESSVIGGAVSGMALGGLVGGGLVAGGLRAPKLMQRALSGFGAPGT